MSAREKSPEPCNDKLIAREKRQLAREEKQLAREAERKERARERAVAAFLKKWEREYDLEMQRKKKNIKLRRRELGSC